MMYAFTFLPSKLCLKCVKLFKNKVFGVFLLRDCCSSCEKEITLKEEVGVWGITLKTHI